MIQLPELFQCFSSVSNGMAEDAFSSYSHLYIILLEQGWKIHASYVNGACIIYMIQGEEKIGTTIINTFTIVFLWNTQSDCTIHIIASSFFSSSVCLQFNARNNTIIIR